MNLTRPQRRGLRGLAFLIPLALIAQFIGIPPAQAFKPFTHNNTGFDARADVIDDGAVTIDGREYPVDPLIVTALRDWPTYYNAGVIGPDGFPDLTMGQSIIHPESTGQWLAYVLNAAWAAQADPSYSPAEKGQILAFSYGFLTHAAGDMWAHTLVNELSGEVFPAVGDILTDAEAASIALRHLVIEGYIGDATAGFDGNSDRTSLPDGDVSDDSTPGVPFDAPSRFVYETLVRQDAPGAPTTARGPILDFFYGLRADLVAFEADDPMPLEAALSAFDDTKAQLANAAEDCSFSDLLDAAHDLVACPIALVGLAGAALVDSAEAFANFVTSSLAAAGKLLLDAYVNAWIEDIDDGLRNWSDFGLSTTRALFDPQARRDTQNDECGPLGSEGQQVRINCEDGIGIVDTLFHETDPFINDHLLSMLGAPDFVGGLREALGELSDLIDSIVGPALNPIREPLAQLKEFAKDKVKEAINDRFGIDIDLIQDFISSPSSKMDITSVPLGPLGTIEVFAPDTHAKLDSYLGLPADHHTGEGGGLADDVSFDPRQFAAYRNTVTTAKLVLLDGNQLDAVLSDLTGYDYHLYGPVNGNFMTTTLPGAGSDPTQWLRLIDGDHAWRSDGAPVFQRVSGGSGNFPIWESCVLRDDGFRALFTDWENGSANFPDLGDAPSTDPNDPAASVSTLAVGSPQYDSGSALFVNGSTPLTVNATDDFWAARDISVDVRVRVGAEAGGAFTSVSPGQAITLGNLPDGPIHVDLAAQDPCRSEAVHTIDLVLDNTPPVVTYTEPALAQYATDQTAPIAYTVDDGPGGSGVASDSVTFDGATAANGQLLDMFFLDAGVHSIAVTAQDNVGNSDVWVRTFRVRATADSLLSNLDRALQLRLITNNGAYNGIRASLEAAIRSHAAGRHAVEHNQLGAVSNQLRAKRGNGFDPATADRFIGWIEDLIQSNG